MSDPPPEPTCESNIWMLIHCSHGFPIQDGIMQVMKYGIFIEVECRKDEAKKLSA